MTVKPELVPLQKPPPSAIRVILDSTEDDTVDVTIKLQVGGRDAEFRVGDKKKATSPKQASHSVPADPDFDSVYYLHEWGPTAAFEAVKVIVDLNGATAEAKAKVIDP